MAWNFKRIDPISEEQMVFFVYGIRGLPLEGGIVSYILQSKIDFLPEWAHFLAQNVFPDHLSVMVPAVTARDPLAQACLPHNCFRRTFSRHRIIRILPLPQGQGFPRSPKERRN